jgi:hypothetical protein
VNVQLSLGHLAQELGQTVGGNGVNFEHGLFLRRGFMLTKKVLTE